MDPFYISGLFSVAGSQDDKSRTEIAAGGKTR